MTRFLFLSAFLVFGWVLSAVAANPLPFTGSWSAPDSTTSAFSLDLTQHGQRLTGYHSAVARSGKRVDAVLSSEGGPSITGTVSGRVAHVHFQSGYDPESHGEALLTLRRDGTLTWKVTSSVGAFYLPAATTLHR